MDKFDINIESHADTSLKSCFGLYVMKHFPKNTKNTVTIDVEAAISDSKNSNVIFVDTVDGCK